MDIRDNSLKAIGYYEIRELVRDNCVTYEAKRMAENMIPEYGIEEARKKVDLCSQLVGIINIKSFPYISRTDGIAEIASRARKGGILSMGELLTVRSMLLTSEGLSDWYGQTEGPAEQLFFGLYSDRRLCLDIERSILSENEMSDDASADLRSIRRKIRGTEASIRELLEKVIKSQTDSKYLQDAVITIRNGRYVVPVKSEYRQNVQGMVHDVSSSGSTFFVEPASVVEANNQITYLKYEEQKEIDRILVAFTERVSAVWMELTESYRKITEIDFILAKARYSITIKGSYPVLNDEGIIDLKKVRHPLISKDKVVAIDLSVGEKYRQLVVTGPNTGGKTVALKTTGLVSAMASSGILIPALDESRVSVFSGIYADIGDDQSIAQNLSTFSGHIRNIVEILRNIDDKALVLMDELGAGTDPIEGAALAQAILEHLKDLGCVSLATTHYAEIKLYAINTEGVENASCEFDADTLSPTYKLLIGTPGKSNALLISSKLGLDKDLIDRAMEHVDTGAQRFEEALSKLEQMKMEEEKMVERARENQKKADKILRDAEKKARELKKQSENEYKALSAQARKYASSISADADRLFQELNDIKKSKDYTKAGRVKEIARQDSYKIDELVPEMEEQIVVEYEELPVKEAVPGLEAFSTETGSKVTINSVNQKNGTADVSAGIMRTRVSLSSLRKIPKSSQKKPDTTVRVQGYDRARDVAPSEINLIGMDTEIARIELDKYLDRVMMGSLSTVYVIHGVGTGALRNMVQNFLRKDRRVKSYRKGEYGEGEAGVTVIEIRR
ncbi:MAG: endonuclease MutS2 [Oscillospiraceae bacterium]|nr:endonuclease MutS2 [Oscillospiraceae bacterium]